MLIISAFFAADAVGRLTDFFYINTIYKKNVHCVKSYWNLFSVTRCSREVMITVDQEAKEYYKLLGYRWYHFFPERRVGVFSVIKPRHVNKVYNEKSDSN